MGRKKAATEAPAPAYVSPAPGYTQPPAQPWQQQGQPQGQAPQQQMMPIGAPPPRKLYFNGPALVPFQGRVNAKIVAIGPASPGNSQFGNRPGWELTFDVNGTAYFGRVGQGDIRHQRLFAKFNTNWVGQNVVIRWPTPQDGPTRAQWIID